MSVSYIKYINSHNNCIKTPKSLSPLGKDERPIPPTVSPSDNLALVAKEKQLSTFQAQVTHLEASGIDVNSSSFDQSFILEELIPNFIHSMEERIFIEKEKATMETSIKEEPRGEKHSRVSRSSTLPNFQKAKKEDGRQEHIAPSKQSLRVTLAEVEASAEIGYCSAEEYAIQFPSSFSEIETDTNISVQGSFIEEHSYPKKGHQRITLEDVEAAADIGYCSSRQYADQSAID